MYEPRHPGDAKDLPLFISRAATEAAVVAIRGVLVVPTTIVQGDYRIDAEQPAANAPAYVVTYRGRRERDWLTASEAVELRQLFADHWPVKDVLPWKVIHALNLSEDAVHLRVLQRALLLISTALEGLIQSHHEKVA